MSLAEDLWAVKRAIDERLGYVAMPKEQAKRILTACEEMEHFLVWLSSGDSEWKQYPNLDEIARKCLKKVRGG